MTARDERAARYAAVMRLSLDRNSPLDVTKTTPLMIVGVIGEIKSRDAHPGCSVSAPYQLHVFDAVDGKQLLVLLPGGAFDVAAVSQPIRQFAALRLRV